MMTWAVVTEHPTGVLTTRHSWYYSLVLVVFLVMTLTAVTVLAPRHAYMSIMETGEGDRLRQLCYSALFVLAAVPLLLRAPAQFFRLMPLSLMALLIWCGATLFWSPVPEIALRRYGLTALLVVAALAVTSQLELERGLRLVGQVLLGLVIASLVAAVILPGLAFHQSGDPEVGTIGDLRGIFYHKNTFGTVAAFATLFALHTCITRGGRLRHWIAFACGGVALALSGSNTALILTIAAGAFLWVSLHKQRKRRGWRMSPAIGIGLVATVIGILLPIIAYFSDLVDQPELFSGRGLVWALTYRLFLENPVFGSGYQSIFQVGSLSSMREMYNSRFIQTLSHAHNAYLELAASIGIVGLLLTIFAVVVVPIRNILRLDPKYNHSRTLMLVLMVYIIAHGMLESGLVDRDRPTWIVAVLIIGLVFGKTEKVTPLGRHSTG